MDLAAAASLATGLVLLVAGAELLVRGASRLALAMGITPLAVGLTVVAFGTSAPELAVSVQGALAGAGDVAVGNVVGSNMFNLLAILGLSAAVGALVVHRRVVRLDLPILLAATVAVVVLARDGRLGRVEGLALLAAVVAYTVWVYRASRREHQADTDTGTPARASAANVADADATAPRTNVGSDARPWWHLVGAIVIGLVGLVAGAQLFVRGATQVALGLGMSELAVGLTIVAAGTSLPELATSIAAAARGQRDIAIGNVVGSNLFNLLAVLGASAAVTQGGLSMARQAVVVDLPLTLLATLVVLPCLVTGLVIRRWEGALLAGAYLGYATVVVLTGTGSAAAGRATVALVAGLVALAVTVTAVGWATRERGVA
jgi:cation:H+ antiporter